jgi:hypothetical protein
MQIRVRRRQGEATVADVELSIFTDDRYIDLDGISSASPAPAGLLSKSRRWKNGKNQCAGCFPGSGSEFNRPTSFNCFRRM